MSDAVSAPTGLSWRGGPVPLEAVAIDVQVRPHAMQTVLSQRYRNREPVPIEARYVFPLDESTSVCGFDVQVDGLRVMGVVAEREQAFATYDDALGAGQGAYLLDQERPDVFTAQLTNLAPGSEIVLILTMVSDLTWAGEDVRVTIPTVVAPRYAPAEDRRGVGRAPAAVLNPPRTLEVHYGLTVNVRADLGAPLRGVESPSHPIAVELDGSEARIALAQRAVPLDRDFILVLQPRERPPVEAAIEVQPDRSGAVQLTLQPRFVADATASEVVFLVDCSTSMRGLSLSETRSALLLAVRSLTSAHTFNIATFGGASRLLFPFSQPYDEAALQAATAFVRDLEADQRRTELARALDGLLSTPPQPGRPRLLFVFTDGQVTQTAEILRIVRREIGGTRVFVFGMGAAPSSHLVRALARAGHGAAEFVAPGERAARKVMRQLERALVPALTDVHIDWGALEVEQAPQRIPVLFSGDRLIVHALVRVLAATVVRVHARGPQGAFEWSVAIDPAHARPGTILQRLAARALIRDLEECDSHAWGADAAGARDPSPGGAPAVRAAITDIACRYGLASSTTSFVAVDARSVRGDGPPVLRRVPALITYGWGGRDRGTYVEPPRPRNPPGGAFVHRPDVPPRGPQLESWTAVPLADDSDNDAAALVGAQMAREHAGPVGERSLDAVVGLQAAEGWWDLNAALARGLGVSLRELRERLPTHAGPRSEAERAWATALVLCWLSSEWQSEHEAWGLLARKAHAWLDDCAAQPTGVDWLAVARQLAGG